MGTGFVVNQFLLESNMLLLLSTFHYITAINYVPANLNGKKSPCMVPDSGLTEWVCSQYHPMCFHQWSLFQTTTTTGSGFIYFTISEIKGQNSRLVVLHQVFSAGPKEVHDHEIKHFLSETVGNLNHQATISDIWLDSIQDHWKLILKQKTIESVALVLSNTSFAK